MNKILLTTLAGVALAGFVANAETSAAPAYDIAAHDVAWDSPSTDARGSMPLGNGDIGINVWVEPSGDLVLLVGKSDSYDEFNRLLKLGRIRIRTTPALFRPGEKFSQKLRLEDGSVVIATPTAILRVWVDANHPVVQVDGETAQPVEARVILENWRDKPRTLRGGNILSGGNIGDEGSSMWGNRPDKMKVNADTILPAKPGRLAWCHHNVESQWRANLELTALGDEIAKGKDPILDRSFGAEIRADGFVAESDTGLKSSQHVSDFSIRIVPLTTFAASPEAWLKKADATADAVPADTGARFAAHADWWRAFWDRSRIEVASTAAGDIPANSHPWRLGMDSAGGSRFGGQIAGATVLDRALSPEEIAKLAAAPAPRTGSPGIVGKEVAPTAACTLSAWIHPAPGETGRILDKCTAGHSDGITFDTHPGLALRFIVGDRTMIAPARLKPGVWQHVAATTDAAGRRTIYLDGKPVASEKDSAAETLSRAYALQRFVNACAGRGALPIKFNGSLFTVEGPDPDYRAWGGGVWWQNTREAYWTMPAAGDFDMMAPLFKMYREALPLRMAATKKYYGHEGAFYPETMYFWGNYMDNENYGVNRKGKPDGMVDNAFIRRYWQCGIELVAMMLDAYDYAPDAGFRDETLLPVAKQITLFYDQHWKRGANGKIRFDPAQSLETWHTAVNPLPEIAGLRFVIPRLLALPADDATKAQWKKLLADLPPVPVAKDAAGNIRLMPADSFGHKSNLENPELYGVFPYRLYTDLADDKKLAQGLNAWRVRAYPQDIGWQQHCIQAPLLGLAKEAQALVVARAKRTAGYRFPGFFGPNYDWTPEQCHGTNMMTGLQFMLMQCEGDRIVLLPAWPKDWNADFKLHAPQNTVVEARVVNGEIKDLKVVPESRRKDVEIRKAQ